MLRVRILRVRVRVGLHRPVPYPCATLVTTCGTAVWMGNFISSLLTLEAEESRAWGTDGYIRCSGTFLSSLASIELETGEIYCEDSMVVTCGTAAGMGNFISLLLILEASKSRVRGTDRCIRCSGTPSLAHPHHCPHLRGSGDGGHGSVCGPGCWMCKQAYAYAGLTFRFRHFGIFRDVRTFVSRLLTIFRKHMLGLSLFPLVLYSFKPQEVYLLVLYTLVIFPSVSVL